MQLDQSKLTRMFSDGNGSIGSRDQRAWGVRFSVQN